MKKSITFTFFKWIVKVGFTARWPWSYFRIHNYKSTWKTHKNEMEGCWHLVWGKFSLFIENWTIEKYKLCSQCDSPEIGEIGYGDESWTVCQSCRSVEQGYRYVNLKEYEKVS